VYGILGLADIYFLDAPIKRFIVPDYHLEVEEVWTSATVQVLLNMSILDPVLSQIDRTHCHPGACCAKSLPSWIPCFTHKIGRRALFNTGNDNSTFDASLKKIHHQGQRERRVSKSTLSLSGGYFDEIKEVLGRERPEDPWEMAKAISFCLSFPENIRGIPTLEVLWRTITADRNEKGDTPAPKEYQTGFYDALATQLALRSVEGFDVRIITPQDKITMAAIMNQFQNTSGEIKEIYEIASRSSVGIRQIVAEFSAKHIGTDPSEIEKVEEGRRLGFSYNAAGGHAAGARTLFKTGRGYLGLGSLEVKPGDQVWLICDACTPYILRPTSAYNTFVLNGDSYIHTFMHGEMLDSNAGLKEPISEVNIV
jgi:hypothetical protein